nr:DNA primase [Maliibacterium massiliense]
MPGFFSQTWLDELRQRCDLAQIVADYAPLKQKGHRYWACCPFHGEKTPSFSVDVDKQLYYCFGCKASGNVFNFIMQAEHMDFAEAVRFLADKVNLPLPEMGDDIAGYRAQKQERERLYEVMREAARFYRDVLFSPQGREAMAYLKRRRVAEATIKRFGLGYAPEGWHALMDHLKAKGVSEQDGLKLGLYAQSKGRTYDAFRGRVIFPIFNGQGAVVGFGGRVMDKSNPKYLNSPETPIFNKRLTLYGMQLLKKARNLPQLILVEGYMDMLALAQSRFEGVLASLGTSLTQEQARLLRRYGSRVVLAYDGDTAGQHAALRGLDILDAEGLEVRVLSLEDGMDPDEYIRTRGRAALEQRISEAMPLPAFKMYLEKKAHDMSTQQGRTQYAIACAKVLARLENPVEREVYLRTLQVETGFSMESLGAQVAKFARTGDAVTSYKVAPDRNNKEDLARDAGAFRAEKRLIEALAYHGRDVREQVLAQLQSQDFTDDACRFAFQCMLEAAKAGRELPAADLWTHMGQGGFAKEAGAFLSEPPREELLPTRAAMEEWIAHMHMQMRQRQIEALKAQLNDPHLAQDARVQLMEEIQELMRAMRGGYRG